MHYDASSKPILSPGMQGADAVSTDDPAWLARANEDPPSMILERLKAETATLHDRIEAETGLMSSALSIARYVEILRAFHAFHADWEPRIGGLIGDEPFLKPRRKLALTARDLAHFGIEPARPSSSGAWIRDEAEAMGSLYVLEGSTLGGRIISRHLERRFGLTAGAGAAYFSSYGEAIGPMWTAFKARLESFSRPSRDDAVVAGAKATFAHLIAAMRTSATASAGGAA